jgi:hypothetical protein
MLDLEPVFYSTGDDWIRYSATNWLIWTDKSTAALFVTLRPHLDKMDQVLIVPIDIDEPFGSLSPWVWNWINSKLPSSPIKIGEQAEHWLLPFKPNS